MEKEKCRYCTKEVYHTEAEAKTELLRILETTYKLKDVKPCRVYFAINCGVWHLTSKPFITEY